MFIDCHFFGCIGSSLRLCGLSLVVASGSYSLLRASHRGGFSCCRAQALGTWASVVAACRLISYSARAPEVQLAGSRTRAQ